MTKLDVQIPGFQILALLSSGTDCSVYQAIMETCNGVSGLMPLITSGQSAERDFLVMPFCGKTLGEMITFHPPVLSSRQSIIAILELLKALQTLHQAGFVHGDIHPDNLFFDKLEHIVLSDFGNAVSIATPSEDTLNTDNLVKGASSFASPEQQRNQSFTSFSDDLYSLTLVLCAMLSSRLALADIRAWCESERENYPSDLLFNPSAVFNLRMILELPY